MMVLSFTLAFAMLVTLCGLLTSLAGLKKPAREMNKLIEFGGIEFSERTTGLERMKKQHSILDASESAKLLAGYEKAIPIYLKWYRFFLGVLFLATAALFLGD